MTEPVRAGIYCRMSLATMNDTTKVDDQERLCREVAGRQEWDVAEVYQDNNRSAWKRNRKRPAWDRMLADVNAGKLTAIIVYHGDRLIRQPFDLETLLNLAEGKGILLASPTGNRSLDSAEDRFVLRIEAAMACRESDNISRRRKAQYARWRREGKVRPGGRGGRAFGFATDGTTHRPDETRLIREAARMVLEGHGAGRVAAWLNESGALTPAGSSFTHGTVRKMLARPRYAGLMPDGVSAAAWAPVLERGTWEAVAALLDTRAAGFWYAGNARKYLLSGIAVCQACGSGLQLRAVSRKPRKRPAKDGYGCVRPGCRKVQRNITLLDAYVTGAVVAQLNDPANPAARIPEAPGLAAEFRALTEARAEVEAALKDHTRGRLPLLLARLDSLDARLAELRELAGDDARARLRDAYTGITRAEFEGLPLDVRRVLVRATVRVIVKPASKRGPGFRTEDVVLAPVTGGSP